MAAYIDNAGVPQARGSRVSPLSGVQARISVILLLLTTIVLLGFSVFSYFSEKTRMQNELDSTADIIAARLVNHLADPVWSIDEDQMVNSLEAEMLDKTVYALAVRDRDGKTLFAGRQRDQNWGVAEFRDQIGSGFQQKDADIIREGEKIGSVEVYLTSRFLQQAFIARVANIAVTALILDLAILLVVYAAVRKIIVNPVVELTAAAERMSKGEMGIVISGRGNDEIGSLARALDRLQNSLRLAMTRLQGTRQ